MLTQETTRGSYSVVVPVYNSSATLQQLVIELQPVLEQISTNYELILVNDGSSDNSWQVIEQLREKIIWITGINLSRNFGQHNALLAGIRTARYEIVITIDDDLQNPPQEIPKLINCLAEGYDVVYGTPQKEQHGIWRVIASQITKLALQNAIGAANASNISAFRAFRIHLRDAFANYDSPFVSIDVLLTWGTVQFAAVPVRHDPRRQGQSNYTLKRLIIHAINLITGFSILPLQVASIMGFCLTFFGILIFLYVIGRYLITGDSVPGFPFLASILAIFSGGQLFVLGIIGEYLGRIYLRILGKPSYLVRKQIQASSKEDTTS